MSDTAPFFADIADAPPPRSVIWTQAERGAKLRVALWPAGPKGMVAIFPGRTEVIEKYGRVITDLMAAGYGAAAIDWRGQGLSDRLTDRPLLGDVQDFAQYQLDVAAYRTVLDRFAPDAPIFVLAHSMGGCIALRALINGFPAQAASFSAPMWGLPLNSTTSRAIAVMRAALRMSRLDQREVPGAGVEFRLWENPFDNNELTGDAETYAWMQAQVQAHTELRLGAPSLRWLAAALAETAALQLLPAPEVAAFCGLGTREKLVSAPAIEGRMAGWTNGRLEIYQGALHELLMERAATRDAFLRATLTLFDENQP